MANTRIQKHDVEMTIEEENATLRTTRSAGAFTISPELFEKVPNLRLNCSCMVLTPTSYIWLLN
jgi:hypothetical protein